MGQRQVSLIGIAAGRYSAEEQVARMAAARTAPSWCAVVRDALDSGARVRVVEAVGIARHQPVK